MDWILDQASLSCRLSWVAVYRQDDNHLWRLKVALPDGSEIDSEHGRLFPPGPMNKDSMAGNKMNPVKRGRSPQTLALNEAMRIALCCQLQA